MATQLPSDDYALAEHGDIERYVEQQGNEFLRRLLQGASATPCAAGTAAGASLFPSRDGTEASASQQEKSEATDSPPTQIKRRKLGQLQGLNPLWDSTKAANPIDHISATLENQARNTEDLRTPRQRPAGIVNGHSLIRYPKELACN